MSATGQQIETYERPYEIVYGEEGGEQRPVPGDDGTDWPIWRARRMIVALLTAQMSKVDDESEREQLEEAKRAFQSATTSEVVFGMVKRWKNRKGKTRFIGLVNKGQDYRKAGQNPDPTKTFRPSQHHPASIDDNTHLRLGMAKPHEAPKPSEAERIAARMAEASRAAVDPDRNGNTAP